MKKPETKIVEAIQEWVEEQDGKALKLHGSSMQELGQPDLIGGLVVIYGGKYYPVHFAVEVKQPGEKPRKIQQYRLSEWENVGYLTGSVSSVAEMRSLIAWYVAEQVVGRERYQDD